MWELALLPTALAAGNWYAVARHDKRLEYFFKPATLIAIILWAVLLIQDRSAGWSRLAAWVLAGLSLSLSGDVFLMLPDRKRFFLPGLASFLLAHVCYIAGLNPSPPPAQAWLLLVPLAAVAVPLFLNIIGGLRRGGQSKLLVFVVAYSLILSAMLFSVWATLFRPEWSGLARLLVVAGGTLFFASDSLLAWERFVAPSPPLKVGVMVTYHLAQFCLAAVLAFAP